jgi:hypothetical protein
VVAQSGNAIPEAGIRPGPRRLGAAAGKLRHGSYSAG